MNIEVKEFIRNHGKMKSKAKILRAQIKWALDLENQLCKAKIEEMSLSRRNPDGMPGTKRRGSRTEYVATRSGKKYEKT